MQERPQNFDEVGRDPEATLVAPRFDAEEERRAHPVVPLAGTRARAPFVEPHARTPYANAHAAPWRGPRRSWPTALFAVVLLAAVAAGGVVATKVMRRPLANTPAQAESAPAPSQAAESPQPQEATPAPQAPREEALAERPTRATREGRGREAGGASIPAQAEVLRAEVEDSDDKDDERRGRKGEKRRERDDDAEEAEKEIRKALKRAKGKAPRLVDVLTGP